MNEGDSKSEKKIAYLVEAHSDPEQLRALVSALDYKCRVFIHLDRKSDIRAFGEKAFPENVVFIEKREKVYWAGFSQVTAILHLIEAALEAKEDFSHVILISGADYPIKSPKIIFDYFARNPKRQFIRYFSMLNNSYVNHIQFHHFQDPLFPIAKIDNLIRRLLGKWTSGKKRKLLQGIDPCYGSSWWAITPDCARYILEYVKKHPEFSKFYRNSFAPDEHFFHTIVANSPFNDQANGIEPFSDVGTFRMANFHIVHPSLSKVYTVEDFDTVKNSDMLFVRKLNTLESSSLIKKIDQELLQE